MNNSIMVLEVRIDKLTREILEKAIDNFLTSSGKYRIMYANIHCINVAYQDEEYRQILNSAHLVLCDGDGVRLGAKILGYATLERIAISDWIYDLCRFCEQKGISLYLLGSREEVIKKSAELLLEIYPNLRIVGVHHGYFKKEDNSLIINEINLKKPDILLVGLGVPRQEKWIDENFELLNIKICIAVGGVFEYALQQRKKAPHWLLNCGFEWIFRLLLEPKRMWSRYLIGNPLFILRCIMARLKLFPLIAHPWSIKTFFKFLF